MWHIAPFWQGRYRKRNTIQLQIFRTCYQIYQSSTLESVIWIAKYLYKISYLSVICDFFGVCDNLYFFSHCKIKHIVRNMNSVMWIVMIFQHVFQFCYPFWILVSFSFNSHYLLYIWYIFLPKNACVEFHDIKCIFNRYIS